MHFVHQLADNPPRDLLLGAVRCVLATATDSCAAAKQ